MRFLIDEDLPRALVDMLRAMGYEAEHVWDAGLSASRDRSILGAAIARGAVLMTADMDFVDLHRAAEVPHSGIVILRFPDHYRRAEILAHVQRFLITATGDDLTDALVMVGVSSYRIRRQR